MNIYVILAILLLMFNAFLCFKESSYTLSVLGGSVVMWFIISFTVLLVSTFVIRVNADYEIVSSDPVISKVYTDTSYYYTKNNTSSIHPFKMYKYVEITYKKSYISVECKEYSNKFFVVSGKNCVETLYINSDTQIEIIK